MLREDFCADFLSKKQCADRIRIVKISKSSCVDKDNMVKYINDIYCFVRAHRNERINRCHEATE